MVSMVISCFPGNRYPGLTTFLLLYYILNLTHQRVHVDQEEGGCEGVCVCVCVCVCGEHWFMCVKVCMRPHLRTRGRVHLPVYTPPQTLLWLPLSGSAPD